MTEPAVAWSELLVGVVFLAAGVARSFRAPTRGAEALIDTLIGLGAVALGVSALVAGPAVAVLHDVGGAGLAAGLGLLLVRRLRQRRSRRSTQCSEPARADDRPPHPGAPGRRVLYKAVEIRSGGIIRGVGRPVGHRGSGREGPR